MPDFQAACNSAVLFASDKVGPVVERFGLRDEHTALDEPPFAFVVRQRLRYYNDAAVQAPNLSEEKGDPGPKHTALVLIEYQNDFTS
jgi:hypothetical protein